MISQREARRLRKRVIELEDILNAQMQRWSGKWVPGWVNFATVTLDEATYAKVTTARLLDHAVIAVPSGSGTVISLYAERLKELQ